MLLKQFQKCGQAEKKVVFITCNGTFNKLFRKRSDTNNTTTQDTSTRTKLSSCTNPELVALKLLVSELQFGELALLIDVKVLRIN